MENHVWRVLTGPKAAVPTSIAYLTAISAALLASGAVFSLRRALAGDATSVEWAAICCLTGFAAAGLGLIARRSRPATRVMGTAAAVVGVSLSLALLAQAVFQVARSFTAVVPATLEPTPPR